MGLEKAILYGKEHRKPYHDSRAIAGECRNHGSCPWCTGNRLYSFEKQKQAAIQKIKEYLQEGNEHGLQDWIRYLLFLFYNINFVENQQIS